MCFIFFLCTEPSASPDAVTGKKQSSTEILVEWEEVPAAQRHGDIEYYTVYWKAEGGGEERKDVYAPTRNLILTELSKFTNYSIKVSASTIKGEGPASGTIVEPTDQDSK